MARILPEQRRSEDPDDRRRLDKVSMSRFPGAASVNEAEGGSADLAPKSISKSYRVILLSVFRWNAGRAAPYDGRTFAARAGPVGPLFRFKPLNY
jgi:hypothetical protein